MRIAASASPELDHLVVAAATLAQGEDHIEALFGARPQRGGRHQAMGTHNSLLKIGSREYLEIIAIDPDALPPARPRWFALDTPVMRARLREAPRLIHWVVRTGNIKDVMRATDSDLGTVHAMRRGDFEWRITIPDDGHLPGAGLVPTLIQWSGAKHPTDRLPESGVTLVALAGAHPEPRLVQTALAALGLSSLLKVTFDQSPRLAAMIRTQRGVAAL